MNWEIQAPIQKRNIEGISSSIEIVKADDQHIIVSGQWTDVNGVGPYGADVALYKDSQTSSKSSNLLFHRRILGLDSGFFQIAIVSPLKPGSYDVDVAMGRRTSTLNSLSEIWNATIIATADSGPAPGPAPTPSPGQLFDSLHISERRYSSSTGTKFIEFTVQTVLGGSGAPVANVMVDLSFDDQPDQAPAPTNSAGIQVFARLESHFSVGNHTVMAFVHTDQGIPRISPILNFSIEDSGVGGGDDPGPGPGPGPSPSPSLAGLQLLGIPFFLAGLAMVWPEHREKVKRKFRKTVHAMKQTSKASKKELARALRILRGRR